MSKNYLRAVFWDFPHLCDPKGIEKALNEAKLQKNSETVFWIMARMLERGRFKDTAFFFRPKEIREGLKFLKISSRARKRWERFLEVYGDIG